MTIIVNGEIVPPELIREERVRLNQAPGGEQFSDDLDGSLRLRDAAESHAIRRVLLRQAIESNKEPLDQAAMDREMSRWPKGQGCDNAAEQAERRKKMEEQYRVEPLSPIRNCIRGKAL